MIQTTTAIFKDIMRLRYILPVRCFTEQLSTVVDSLLTSVTDNFTSGRKLK